MRDYIIATSSTSDLPRTYLDEHHIPFIPYTFTVGDRLCEREGALDCAQSKQRTVLRIELLGTDSLLEVVPVELKSLVGLSLTVDLADPLY